MLEILEQRIAPATLIFSKALASSDQSGSLIATDPQGNVLVAGVFKSGIDVDLDAGVSTLSTSSPFGEVYVVKYSPDGTLLWSQTWGGSAGEQPRAMTVDANGDVFVVGEFGGTAGFGGSGSLSATGGVDAFVIKLSGADGSAVTSFDGDGQLTWGGTYNEFPLAVTLDGAGHLLVGGTFDSTDAGYNGAGALNAGTITGFLLRMDATTGAPDNSFDSDGMLSLGVSDQNVAHIAVDSNHDIYLAIEDFGAFANHIRKLSAVDGSLATGFGGTGVVTLPFAGAVGGNFGLVVDGLDRVIAAQSSQPQSSAMQPELTLFAFHGGDGTADSSFNSSGTLTLTGFNAARLTLAVDANQNLAVGGVLTNGKYFLDQVTRGGAEFGHVQIFGEARNLADVAVDLSIAYDAEGYLFVRGTHLTGTADLDPTAGILKRAPRADVLSNGMLDGFVTRIDTYGIDAKTPLTFSDIYGEQVHVTIEGAGRAHYHLSSGALNFEDISSLQLFDTDLTTKVKVAHTEVRGIGTSVGKIFTAGANQDVGSITLGSLVSLGDYSGDYQPEVRVTGRLSKLTLDGVHKNALIKLGEGLPYNVPNEETTSDTYNNHPDITVREVYGDGVMIDVTGDGNPAGIGGGGLGNVTFGAWGYTGLIRTTQSIGNLTIKTGDFLANLQVDKAGVGAATQANVGTMSILGGSWGSSATEVEGDIKAFNAESFLAGASITAGSIGNVKMSSGSFDGTLILTDPDAPTVPVFTVSTDFTGHVVSATSIKKLNIKGDFTGSLQAPSIGAITAYSFLGVNGVTQIVATHGALGLITSTAGVIRDYEIITNTAFSGFKVTLGKLKQDTAGIDNVKITAVSIGSITVKLTAAADSTDVNLVGIRNSQFTTTGTGTLKPDIGSIGNVSVTLAGVAGGASAIGMQQVNFDARVVADELGSGSAASTVNTLGKITVKVTGSGGDTIGLDGVTFEGDSIGATKITVGRAVTESSTARAIAVADYTATGAIGAMTISGDATSAQVTELNVWAGRTVGAVSVKATTAANGSLEDSAILAGQSLALNYATDIEQLAALSFAKLGAVNVSGSITNTKLVAGGSLGAVTAGKNVSDSLILAGAIFGGDFVINGNESYHRAASIAAITVKGDFARTSVAAGVDPGDDIFGNEDDSAAAYAGSLIQTGAIGAVNLAGATVGAGTEQFGYAIEAAALTGLKLGAAPMILFPLAVAPSLSGLATESILVRTLA